MQPHLDALLAVVEREVIEMLQPELQFSSIEAWRRSQTHITVPYENLGGGEDAVRGHERVDILAVAKPQRAVGDDRKRRAFEKGDRKAGFGQRAAQADRFRRHGEVLARDELRLRAQRLENPRRRL